jgi:Holliday junction resolvase RusA-like endonuclease
LTPWRRAVADYARVHVRQSGRVFHGPTILRLAFLVPMPSPRSLRRYPYPIRQRDCDCDKLARAVADALVHGGLLVDDKLVVDLTVSKRWGVPAGVQITVAPLIEELTLADVPAAEAEQATR